MNTAAILPMEVEKSICNYISRKYDEDDLRKLFQNPLLRDDVLDLLDRYCTVVYYPLENESNNGFHVTNIPQADGVCRNFVFINTAQTIEKQVFTAAHELGHIWQVDDYVINDLQYDSSGDSREKIINRFAAVLLIPAENFSTAVTLGLRNIQKVDDCTIPFDNLLRLIITLMGQFYVPMKAVVCRMIELNFLPEQTANILLGAGHITDEALTLYTKRLAEEMGYTKFLNPSRKKWIEGLADILNVAEKDKLVPQEKIDNLREAFDLKCTDTSLPAINLSIRMQKGIENNDN